MSADSESHGGVLATVGIGGLFVTGAGLIYLVDSGGTYLARGAGGAIAAVAFVSSLFAWRITSREAAPSPSSEGAANVDGVLLWSVFAFGVVFCTLGPVLAIGLDITPWVVTAMVAVISLVLFAVTSFLVHRRRSGSRQLT
jgi:hypothetical protein